ncbi:MAG: hypothetical protein QJR08_06395 [Bacillota bacterium]|nr:hypothetical protein [Bacillota bacterium]MDI3317813.1 hypothetical protein [Bacillota bacterium]
MPSTLPADPTKWPFWIQIVLLLILTYGFYAAGFRLARRFPPERYLFQSWYLNLAVIAIGLWAIVLGITMALPPLGQKWASMFGPALAFGLAYGIIQTQMPRPQPRPRPRPSGAPARTRGGQPDDSLRPVGAGRTAWTGRPRKKRRPGPSR